MPSKRVLWAAGAAAAAACLTIVVAGFTFLNGGADAASPAPLASEWDNVRLLNELGPEQGVVPGDALGLTGAAVGAAAVWTFWSDTGLRVPTGTGSGIGVIVENGTGQPVQAYLVWDE